MLKGRSPILGVDARSPWAKGADLWYDFTKKANGITDTHADTIYAAREDGLYLPYAANVLTRDSNGLQTVPTRTNLVLQSQDLTNAAWTAANASVAASVISGSVQGSTLQEITSSNGNGNRVQSTATFATTMASVYTATFDFVAGSSNFGGIVTTNTAAGAIFNLTGDGSVVSTTGAGAVSAAIVKLGSVYRASLVYTALSTSEKIGAGVSDGTTYAFSKYPSAASGTVYAGNAQNELGAFASPPILTAGASATVNGNKPVISDLGTQLAVGVAGIVQVTPYGADLGVARVIELNAGSADDRLFVYNSGGNWTLRITTATVTQATITLGPITIGASQTIAFVGTEDYLMGQIVGQSAPTPDTTAVSWPVINRLAIGGQGYNAVGNGYQFTKKLALKFGPQDATTFDEWYKKALTA